MMQRMVDEWSALARNRVIELGFSFAFAVFVVQQHVLLVTLLGWAVIYLAWCWLLPLRNCGRCGGEGKPRTGDGHGNWRDRVCRRCRGAKERRRWGAVLLGRGTPDRHDAKV